MLFDRKLKVISFESSGKQSLFALKVIKNMIFTDKNNFIKLKPINNG